MVDDSTPPIQAQHVADSNVLRAPPSHVDLYDIALLPVEAPLYV